MIHTKQVFASGVVAVDFSLDSTVTCSHAGVPLLLPCASMLVHLRTVRPGLALPFYLLDGFDRLLDGFDRLSDRRSDRRTFSVLPPLPGCS